MPEPAKPAPPRAAHRLGVLLLAAVAMTIAIGFGAATQDDAFISFRYAEHLISGLGLVYNPGEYVEGYTNLSWTLLMALFMGLGVDPVRASVGLGVLCLGGAVWMTGRLSGAGRWALVAPMLVAVDAQLALESVEGLETALYVLLITAAAVRLFREQGSHGLSTLLFALAALTRPEAPLIMALLHLGLAIRRRSLRAALAPGLAMALVLAGLTAWRLWYYGDPLPNTFYAKTGGFALPRGIAYIWAHMRTHPVLWGLVVLRPLAGPSDRRTLPLALTAAGALAYVAWVGGDFKPTGRFILPVMPMLAVLAAQTVAGLGRRRWWLPVMALGLAWSSLGSWRVAKGWATERHANLEARRTVGEFLAAQFPADTLLAIHSAGVVPYYAGMVTIDMWGLTDRHIARASVGGFGTGLAGHERSDPAYVFARDPDLYLPEDHVFSLRPWDLQVPAGFPDDFTQRYAARSIPVQGRWLNLWARRGFLSEVLSR